MKRILFIIPFIILLTFSCESLKNKGSTTKTKENLSVITEKDDREITLIINNPTVFNVYFEGNLEQKWINRKSTNEKITLITEKSNLSGGFNLIYEIPLSDKVPLFCRGGHEIFRTNSSYTIKEPIFIADEGLYITILNRINNAITFYTGSWEQTGSPVMGNYIAQTDKREFSPGETAVFKIDRNFSANSNFIRDGRRNIPLVIPYINKENYLYSFEYTTNGVELTDSRPLYRIGESSWVKTIDDADCLMPLVSSDGEISLFASISRDNKNYKKGLNRIVYESSGNDKNTKSILSGDSFQIAYTSVVNDGFFVAGYKIEGRNQQARVVSVEGVTRHILPESDDYESVRYLTAAQQNDANIWLLAGDGRKNIYSDITAYARLIRYEDSKLTVVKEWGGSDFQHYKNIKAASYNNKLGCWLITGKIIESSGFYLARINNDGKIQKISEFQGMEFNKILVDANGNYYLAGQEQKGNDTLAVLYKYSIDNKRIWQASKLPPSHSYYFDAILTTDNNFIVLAGTLRAKDEYGTGGKPFIEAVDIANGTCLWHEILSDSDFNGTALVTSIASVPDYGYILTLSGITNGFISKTFKITRINSQGKLKKF